MITLIDGLNTVRIGVENDPTGRYPRSLIAQPAGTVIWVWDGKGSKSKRLALYPAYKSKREAPPDTFFVLVEMVQEVLKHTHAIQISVPGYEADDVIATLALRYRNVTIHSTDGDFAQLVDDGIRTITKPKNGLTGSDVRLFKSLVGDPSDAIPGLRGFGIKAWEKLSSGDRRVIQRRLEGDDQPTDFQRIEENLEQLRIFWKIVGFYDVPIPLINEHMIVGTPNPAGADAYLKKYLQ